MNHSPLVTRRAFCGGLAAAGALAAMPVSSAFAQSYPQRNFRVIIPTGQGGGAERLARAFDDAWSKLLKRQFEYTFHPGAAGQIGYELFVKQREADGYNLLFGNMGPEMIMYAVQKPNYRFPEDFIYFSRTDID
jgi:tripartite-type tricarboxylate transporter receptor subunit TctC